MLTSIESCIPSHIKLEKFLIEDTFLKTDDKVEERRIRRRV